MTRKFVTALVVAASVLTTVSVAEAGGKKGRHFGGKHFHGHVWHDFHGHRPRGCGFYLKKAKYTGSPYWFNKYRACIGVYY